MKSIPIFFLIAATIIYSCSKTDDTSPEAGSGNLKEIELAEGAEFVIESLNNFGLDIFQLLYEDTGEDTNIFISPTSISLALAMTLNGANNATEDSMVYALRMDHLAQDQINETYRDLIKGLTSCDEKVLLEIANSIWYRMGYPVLDGFLNVNNDYYNAEVRELDFAAPDAKDIINGWVAEKTHDKIPTILNQVSPAHVMFLINAIYFKGIWALEFNEESTYDGTFQLADQSNKEVPMMHMQEVIPYYENDLFQACELDYGQGNYSMVVLLPKYDKTLTNLVNQLDTENWTTWTTSFDTTKVDLSLPRFTFEYEKKLNNILSQMGMGVAFSSAADFSGIKENGGLKIDYVKHKTFVEVNEEGTEAAAVTIVAMMETTAIGPPSMKYMSVNRPFLFVIREKTTNSIVFIGKVAEPVAE